METTPSNELFPIQVLASISETHILNTKRRVSSVLLLIAVFKTHVNSFAKLCCCGVHTNMSDEHYTAPLTFDLINPAQFHQIYLLLTT
jgi:hypothetical protein